MKIILQQQQPLLTQRLNTTLDKLSAPEKEQSKIDTLLSWWNQLKVRYNRRNIDFLEKLECDFKIPVDIYDSIIENLLENARNKRILEPNLEIIVQLECFNQRARLTVCDTGKSIPEHIAAILFTTPIDSENGFGIGLYQSQQQAKQYDIELELYENTDRRVCFRLEQQTRHPERSEGSALEV